MSEYLYGFEKLEVWQDARAFVSTSYKLINSFPAKERFCLCQQLQRAAISVPSNIAEGMSRSSTKEQIHFIEIAYGSLMEVYCQFYIALDLQYITQNQMEEIKPMVDKISNKLNALKRSIEKRVINRFNS